jgi:hypothetical protein
MLVTPGVQGQSPAGVRGYLSPGEGALPGAGNPRTILVSYSRGAGAEPPLEREVSSHHPSFYFVPPQAAQNKNALHPFAVKDEERHIALVVPPSFIDASRHQPCRVLTYSRPITGATGRDLLSRQAISSRGSGVFFAMCRRMGFPAITHSLHATGNCYSPLQGFCSMQL